ncbi:MAG: hypothetical protein GY754_12170, partial [bacterium]|nr:hypothetical protein [bacterium]
MKKIISGIFVLTCFLPVRLFPADIISGDSVSVTAFSKDERYVAIEISSIDTAVGGNYQPPAWLVLADSYNKNIIQKTLITKEISPDCESDTIAERLRRANKKRKERAYNNLKRKNYAFEVNKFNFAQNIEVKHRILKEDDSNGEAVIYLYHGDTRYSMTVGRVAVSDRPAGGEGFSLRGISASPNEKTLVVSYGEHPVMEFDAGLDGALIINRFNLSYFYNSVGFEYYKKKSYREA